MWELPRSRTVEDFSQASVNAICSRLLSARHRDFMRSCTGTSAGAADSLPLDSSEGACRVQDRRGDRSAYLAAGRRRAPDGVPQLKCLADELLRLRRQIAVAALGAGPGWFVGYERHRRASQPSNGSDRFGVDQASF